MKSKLFKWKKQNSLWGEITQIFHYLHSYIGKMNESKLFAGLIIIILNISSKFVSIKLSKSMESYLKNTFSRDVLIFAMAWMGTRDIYISVMIMLIFKLAADYLLNEESRLCCLPESFTTHHLSIQESTLETPTSPTEEEVKQAREVLDAYENAKKE